MTQYRQHIALVVEPDARLREILRELIIEQTIFWPLVVSNRKDALRMLRDEGPPDVLIVDNDLPDGTGAKCFFDICDLELKQNMVDLRYYTRKVLLCHDGCYIDSLPRRVRVFRGPYDRDTLARLVLHLRRRNSTSHRGNDAGST
ncbi:hypothetical protein [Ktedonospora formicarum]|uniref:hypothetical protein n=1 Tax=Ktedonospora formicarum TaxID=2778364 RepID=UPI001C6886D8|nr:hypothetical protein [Ktedonospora formicarum]